MYKKLFGTLALALSLVLSTTVFAHSSVCGEGMQKMLESLKLDSAQKDKIKPILDNMKTSMKDNAVQMRELSKQINAQVMSTNMDQTAVNGLIDQKVKLIGDRMKAKMTAKNQIYAVLNAQQKTILQDKMKKMEDRMEEKFKSCHDQE